MNASFLELKLIDASSLESLVLRCQAPGQGARLLLPGAGDHQLSPELCRALAAFFEYAGTSKESEGT